MIPLLPTFSPDVDALERTEMTFAPGEVRGMELRPGCVVRVRSGVLWLTQEGEGVDHLLAPGEALVISRRGRVVLQAMRGAATVTMV